MADIFEGPFGTYTTYGGNLLTRTKDQIALNLTALKNLIPYATSSSGRSVTYATDFDQIPPHICAKLHAEIDALLDANSKTSAALSPT